MQERYTVDRGMGVWFVRDNTNGTLAARHENERIIRKFAKRLNALEEAENPRVVKFYYAEVDDFGVLCVDRLADETQDSRSAAALAESYPHVIYFEVEGVARDE